jgi:hypothetical protein
MAEKGEKGESGEKPSTSSNDAGRIPGTDDVLLTAEVRGKL